MIDTIRVLIPLSKAQYLTAYGVAKSRGQDRWVFHKASTHSIWIRNVRDVMIAELDSYERDVVWSVPGGEVDIATGEEHFPSPPYYMTVELSLPKFWYGHNISLLHNWPAALELLKDRLKTWFCWRSLPKIESWGVSRVDFCYAWRVPDEETAIGVTELMKRLRYPQKRPDHYHGTAMWRSGHDGTYTAKVYAKGLEFRKHDKPKLLHAGEDEDWVKHLEERAKNVVRWEITGKYKFVRRLGIETVEDLMGNAQTYSVSPDLWKWIKDLVKYSQDTLTPIKDPTYVIDAFLREAAIRGELPLNDDESFTLEPGQVINIPEMCTAPDKSGNQSTIPAGTIRVEIQLKTEWVLQTYLKKLVGNGDMSNADEVKEILKRHCKGAKAGRLYYSWLAIQREGIDEAREMIGKDALNRDIRQLKSLGIPILEKTGVLINPGNEFWTRYRIEVPSPFVVNSVDDFRTHENLINLADRLESERQSG